ncbi:MAG: glucose-1-phosphate adenylyltransferase [Eubacteriales bacterium]|nr:glucose-1-phosphate adenylyltransferase [Eubacteriales bacterium]
MKKEAIAVLLAGGQGSRLGVLTKKLAKPAVLYGGKYRIIDFSLSNCTNSGIDTVGVMTQYRPQKLNSHIGIGKPWDMDIMNGGVTILSPYLKDKIGQWYLGTANAVFQNIEFVDKYSPDYIIVLSGDHIYKMDYTKMLDYHKQNKADSTIAVIDVPYEEASRYGIMNTRENGQVYEFEEKPAAPKSTLASMGIYIFNRDVLRDYLLRDQKDPHSEHDFGRNIIPAMLLGGQRIWAYKFSGYWKDVGTIHAYWESNMDLIQRIPEFNLYDPTWKIYTPNPVKPAHYIGTEGRVRTSIVAEGCVVNGNVSHSILFPGVFIGKNTVVKDSIIMSNCVIGENNFIEKCIFGEDVETGENVRIGLGEALPNECNPDVYTDGITVIGEKAVIPDNTEIGKNVMIDSETGAEEFSGAKIESGKCVLKGEQ